MTAPRGGADENVAALLEREVHWRPADGAVPGNDAQLVEGVREGGLERLFDAGRKRRPPAFERGDRVLRGGGIVRRGLRRHRTLQLAAPRRNLPAEREELLDPPQPLLRAGRAPERARRQAQPLLREMDDFPADEVLLVGGGGEAQLADRPAAPRSRGDQQRDGERRHPQRQIAPQRAHLADGMIRAALTARADVIPA